MRTLDSIIQDFEKNKEGGLSHRRPFLNLKTSRAYFNWQETRCYA
ncbi:hypothetical protein [Christiangramia aestuarii]|nr:hypothetical protein [Christiangramia aestuarii]